MTVSKPSSAPTIAVATPCWPAPVSAISRRLAHALREQALAEHLVGLVRAAVEQVLALQIDVAGQVAAAGQRRRPAGIIGQQAVELGRERGVVLRVEEGGLELLERGHQDLGHVAAAEAAEAAAQAHARNPCRDAGRSASNRAAIFSGDFTARQLVDRRADVDRIGAELLRRARVVRADAAGDHRLGRALDDRGSASSRRCRPVPPAPLSNSRRSAASNCRERVASDARPPSRFRSSGGSRRAARGHIQRPRRRAAEPRARPSIVRGFGDLGDRGIAEHADRGVGCSGASRSAWLDGQRRAGFRARTRSRRRSPAGAAAKSSGRLQSAQFDAAEDQLARRLRAGSAARISDEPTRKPSTMRASRSTSPRLAMPDSETSMRSGASGASRSVVDEVDRKVAQVAVVDADQRRAERQRAAHLGFVMNLDQRVHAEPRAPRRSSPAPRRRRAATASPGSRRRRRSAPRPPGAGRGRSPWRGSARRTRRRAAARSSSEPPK